MVCTNPVSSDNGRGPWLIYFGFSSVYAVVSQKSLLTFMEFKVVFQNLLPEWCLRTSVQSLCWDVRVGCLSLGTRVGLGRIWKVMETRWSDYSLDLKVCRLVILCHILSPSCASLYTGMIWGVTGDLGGPWPSSCISTWFVHIYESSTDAGLLWCSFNAPSSSLCFLPESFWSGAYFALLMTCL